MERQWEKFAHVFRPGMNVALVGAREAGKSWTASYFASVALERNDYLVASNILCKRWLPAEGEPEAGTWEEAYPRGYHKVNSYYALFGVIEEALRRRRHVLFVLDEAGALAKTYMKGETAQSQPVRDSIAFMAISRHLGVATLIMSQSLENLGVSFRGFENGLLDLVIRKPSKTRREMVVFGNERGDTITAKVGARGLAHSEAWAIQAPGRVVYADSVASFDRGVYPGTRIAFRLRELLDALSDELPDRYPEIIREHLARPMPTPAEEAKAEAAAAVADAKGESLHDEAIRRWKAGEAKRDIAKDLEKRGHRRTSTYDAIHDYEVARQAAG